MELEKGRISEDILIEITKQSEEQLKIISDLKEKNQICEDKVNVSNTTIQKQQELMDLADKNCDQKVKDAKPKLTTEILKAVGITILGIIIGVLLL